MGIKERKDAEKHEMKRKIKAAAIEIVNENGYEKLSIRNIAAKIEYSPTTIYLYYKDKAQIIEDMTENLYQQILANGMSIINQCKNQPIDQQIQKVLLSFTDTLLQEPEMARTIMHSGTNQIFGSGLNQKELPSNCGISALDSLLESGIEAGILKAGVKDTSWMLLSALLGFILAVIENQLYLKEDFTAIKELFVTNLLEGIYH